MAPPNAQSDRDTAELDALARAVGLIVIQWGSAEQSLDLLVAAIWHCHGGNGQAKRIPIMLERKVAFVRLCLQELPSLARFRDELVALLAEYEVLAATRHDLIHGAIASISLIDNAYVFAKLDVREGFHHHREVRIGAEDYPRLVDQLVKLGRRANDIGAAVFEAGKQSEVIR